MVAEYKRAELTKTVVPGALSLALDAEPVLLVSAEHRVEVLLRFPRL
jgi:hypothetical protein